MVSFAPWMLAAPLVGFLLLISVGRRLGERISGLIGTAAISISFVFAFLTFLGLIGKQNREVTQTLFTWIPSGSFNVKAALLIDPLSITMCLFVTFISALIHLYSTRYMHEDKDFTKFFVYLNLFVFSMLVLVTANNLLLTFVGWEGVGVCSYWLVSYFFFKDVAASAGKKAFVYNRIGDVGLLLAMFLLFSHTGTLEYLGMFNHLGSMSSTVILLVVLSLLLAAAGKSAQIPLFNWLPDAMEGPTPVSALIHAATMVTAGVYLLCRMNPVLGLSSNGRLVIAIVGGLTAFVAATIATSQQDIKKVLAFSTVSQIAYMVMAVGSCAYIAAMFLMIAHAFYKALLFLGAGSVIHGLHDEQDIRHMGGLRKLLPWTYGTFLIGWLSIAGVPPFASFWSKGDVLDLVYSRYPVLWALGMITAILTAYYMSRLFFLVFTGEARFDQTGPNGEAPLSNPHESPWAMRLPLVVLALGSIMVSIIDLPFEHRHNLASFLAPVFAHTIYEPPQATGLKLTLAGLETLIALAGIAVAWILYREGRSRPELEPAFLANVWYWDDVYDATIGRPGTKVANAAAVADIHVLDRAVNGIGSLAVAKAKALRTLSTGQVRQYALAIIAGVAALLAFVLMRTF